MTSTVNEFTNCKLTEKIVIQCTISVNCTPTTHNIGSTMPPCVTNIKLDTVWEKYSDYPQIMEFFKLQINRHKIVANFYLRVTVSGNWTPNIQNIGSTIPPCVTNIKFNTVWERYADMPSTIIELTKLQVNRQGSCQLFTSVTVSVNCTPNIHNIGSTIPAVCYQYQT